MKRILLLVFLLLLKFGNSQKYNFENYSLENGLPQSTVYDIFQDKKGFIWLGTSGGGLVQFDGIKFKSYSKRDGLSGNSIRAINQDSKGLLWIGTDNGISIYNGLNFRNLKLCHKQESKTVYKIFIDSNNCIWVSFPGFGLLQYKNNNDTIPKIYTIHNGLSSNFIFDIVQLNKNEIILTTYNGGITILNTSSGISKIINKENGLPSDIVLCTSKDNKGNFWFGCNDSEPFYIHKNDLESHVFNSASIKTSKNINDKTVWDITCIGNDLYFATDKSGILKLHNGKTEQYSTENGLPSNQILKLFNDKNNILWAGTNGNGLSKFNGKAFSHFSLNKHSGKDVQVFNIIKDRNGFYWVAEFGTGLSKLSFKDGNVTIEKTFTTNDGLPDNFLTSLCLDNNNNIWIGTNNNGIAIYDGKKFKCLTEKDGLSHNKINSIFQDSQKRIWISTPNGVTKYENNTFEQSNESNGLINNEVQCVTEDKLGNIWIATYGGIAKYNGTTLQNFNEEDGLYDLNINCIAVNSSNQIYIGAFGGGLYTAFLDKSGQHKFKQIANDSILTSNNIYGICFINNETLILTTDKGFNLITIDKNKIIKNKSFNKTDGFTSIENNINAVLNNGTGTIWFGTVKDLTVFDIKNHTTNNTIPVLHFMDIQLFSKSINWTEKGVDAIYWNEFPDNLTLTHNENNLTFLFQAINFKNPYKVKYKYKLIGSSDKWISVNLPEANFSALTPGDYTFLAMASNEDGLWSDELSYRFTILSPFYKTWWFISAILLLIIFSTILYIKIREKELKKKNLILEKTVEERTYEISEQKKQIEHKNKDITDSIIYARRIQKAILPPEKKLLQFIKDSFVLYNPKDIISGDFYYFNRLDNNGNLLQDDKNEFRYIVIAVADCTGHGVPGALMSMIGYNGLNYAFSKTHKSGEILDCLSEFVENALAIHSPEAIKDGMDICLSIFDRTTNTIQYSGANNPLYIIRQKDFPIVSQGKLDKNEINGKLLYEIKADKQPIGAFENRKKFTTNYIPLFIGDELILFTDGFADQFGGPLGKKFKYSALKYSLMSMSKLPFIKQKEELENIFSTWKGNLEQVDDVCIVATKFL